MYQKVCEGQIFFNLSYIVRIKVKHKQTYSKENQ